MAYDFKKIEQKWQKKWEEKKIFEVEADDRKKYYIAIVYPYMNGLLHLGHLFTYTLSEVMARYKRMQGYNTLVKFGFHCTGTPIVAAADRIKTHEKKQIEILKQMGISEKEIPKFSDPLYWIEYFPKETVKDLKAMGFAIDYRYTFRTTSENPPYDKFVQWQFNKLKSLGYVQQGEHPVVWCPKDNGPVGDHDRLEGEGETPQEFLLFKHKLDDGSYLISATLRQDTVLGITNLFVNPDAKYVETRVNNEKWILGEPATVKLANQGFKVKVLKELKGSELIGKKVQEFDGRKVLVLPASFLDSAFGTGLVHSVPSDSADDLIALKDLQKDEKICKKFNLDIKEVKAIKPIPVLNTPGYGDVPTEVMLQKYKIKSQGQREELEEIKKELYKLSHYQSKFNSKYKNGFSENLEGKSVSEGKDIIKKDLVKKGFAIVFYELSGKVICRCLTECVVKLVDDQWFITYDNSEWKKKAHYALDKMKIYPEVVKKQFDYVIDWLRGWACTREYGLGTHLPWDKKWVIESLSDSTIQMAYNTISKYLEHPKDYGFSVEQLNDEFFDYIYLGKGNVFSVEKSTKIPKKMLEKMKSDFDYWYPFDFRNSGKDLVQNHLTFSIFNHCAIFPEKNWPKAFVINGRVLVNNEKMSKSKGNFFTTREIYEKYGADASRLTSVVSGEGADDSNFDLENIENVLKKLSQFYDFVVAHYKKNSENSKLNEADEKFIREFNQYLKKGTEALDKMLYRTAFVNLFYQVQKLFKEYTSRKEINQKVLNEMIEKQLKILSPFCPHITEELWEKIGMSGFISNSEWPKYDAKKMDVKKKTNEIQQVVTNVIEDIISLKSKLVKGGDNQQVYVYAVPSDFPIIKNNQEKISTLSGVSILPFAVNDLEKFDPENRSKKAKLGKPSLFIEPAGTSISF